MNKKLLVMLLALSLGASVHQAKPFYNSQLALENCLTTMKYNQLNQEVINRLNEFVKQWNDVKIEFIKAHSNALNPNAFTVYFDHARNATAMLESIYTVAMQQPQSELMEALKNVMTNAINAISEEVETWINKTNTNMLAPYNASAGNALNALREKITQQTQPVDTNQKQ